MSIESRQLLNLSKIYREKVAEDKDWGYDKKGNSLNPKDKKKKLKTKDTVDEAIGTAIATGAALGIAAGGAALIPKVKKFGQNLKNKAQQRTQMKTEEKKAVKDFDGDGKLESPEDEYKGSKDKAIKKAMKKESFSNWRQDLQEIPDYDQIPVTSKKDNEKIVEKKVKNTIKINPEMKEDVEIISEKEVDVKDTRRTVDAIRAYDKSKDASRDADWDTEHGKKEKGDIEKKYAKKERGEIDKDDPNWKKKKGHTGMHGEETELGERWKGPEDIKADNRKWPPNSTRGSKKA